MAAFDIAERYHTPVIIASDLALGLSPQSVPESALEASGSIDRGPIASSGALKAVTPGTFARYAASGEGISPRTLPGQSNGQYLASGVEHNARGNVTEDAADRVAMIGRRAAKLGNLPLPGLRVDGPVAADVLMIAVGSTGFAALEAAVGLRARGLRCTVARIRVLSPLPLSELSRLAAAASLVLVVENNSTAQLAGLLRLSGLSMPLRSVLKYDGRPFDPDEIAACADAWVGRPSVLGAEPLVVGGALGTPTPLRAARR